MAWRYSCVQTCQRTHPNHIAFRTNQALIHLSKAVPQRARINAAQSAPRSGHLGLPTGAARAAGYNAREKPTTPTLRGEPTYIPGIGRISTISIRPPGIICRWGWLLPNSFVAASWDCAWTIE